MVRLGEKASVSSAGGTAETLSHLRSLIISANGGIEVQTIAC
jgi:hypothetical protein